MPNFPVLHMDNAPHHTAAECTQFLGNNIINHRPAPTQSPDLDPIELVWHNLKVWLSNVWLPRTRAELRIGIKVFWIDVFTIEYCNNKINHLPRVLHKVVDYIRRATGL